MKRLIKILLYFSVIIAMALGLFLLFPTGRPTVWTFLFLSDFINGEAPSLFKILTPDPVVTGDTLYLADELQVPFDLYRPETPSSSPSPALLFTHGLAHRGYRDLRSMRN